jgi:hypothetical protein
MIPNLEEILSTYQERSIKDEVAYIGSERLHHYCTLRTLQGVLQNKELWLTNASSMNDRTELSDFIERLYQSVLDELSSPDAKTKCELFFNTYVRVRLKDEYPYILCL